MTLIRCFFLLAMLIVSAAQPANAQYMYLDSNGNGVHDVDDVLNPNGTATTVDIYLITNVNADSSAAYCTSDPSMPLTAFGYSINLLAANGEVTFSGFTSQVAAFTTAFGEFNPGDGRYKNGLSASHPDSALPVSGAHRLATLTITGTSGTPQVDIVANMVGVPDPTFFGTSCLSADIGPYVLGTDWLSVSGLGPAGGGNAAPAAAVPAQLHIQKEVPTVVVGEFCDADLADSIAITVDGLPPGLTVVVGTKSDGRVQARLYGILGEAVPSDAAFTITWVATDGRHTQQVQSVIQTRPYEMPPEGLDELIIQTVTTRYIHGMPKLRARSLGAKASPILSKMLRDEKYKRYWSKIANAIGLIGDTAYFDTLRSFIWDRFNGPIDRSVYLAIRSAQGSLSTMATISPRVLDYLIATAFAERWLSAPWVVPDWRPEDMASTLRKDTIVAIAYTDSETASRFIDGLSLPTATPFERSFRDGLRRVSQKVRATGYVQVWADAAQEDRKR